MSDVRAVTIPEEVRRHLNGCDPVMAAMVRRLGPIEYNHTPDLWRALVGSIVGQQLSVAAAATIRNRVAALGSDGFPTPHEVLAVSDEVLRACGLSRPKMAYVRDIARRWTAGEILPEELAVAPDEAVIAALTAIKGVGRWTAEMVLIFSLGRPDVLAVDDLGIRVAVQRAYGLEARPDPAQLHSIGDAWRPYRSYASLYLWRSLKD